MGVEQAPISHGVRRLLLVLFCAYCRIENINLGPVFLAHLLKPLRRQLALPTQQRYPVRDIEYTGVYRYGVWGMNASGVVYEVSKNQGMGG